MALLNEMFYCKIIEYQNSPEGCQITFKRYATLNDRELEKQKFIDGYQQFLETLLNYRDIIAVEKMSKEELQLLDEDIVNIISKQESNFEFTFNYPELLKDLGIKNIYLQTINIIGEETLYLENKNVNNLTEAYNLLKETLLKVSNC